MSKTATFAYDNPDAGELLVDAVNTFAIVSEMQITSPAMYELFADQLRDVKGAIKGHTERRLGITRTMDKLKQDVMSLFTPALTKLEEAKTFLENAMLTYNAEQERLRAAEQKRLDDIARAERERLTEEARKIEAAAHAERERVRLANEAAIASAKGAAAKQAAKIAAENATAIAEAAAAAAQEEAEALVQTASIAVAATSVVAAPTASGTSKRGTWKGKCEDKLALVKFIAGHPEYIGLVDVNDSALNALAKSQKENMRVDGCTAKEEFSITTRGVK